VILLTVGHQMAFDRLVRWTDEWAAANPDVEVVAQVADGEYQPRHMRAQAYLSPAEFEAHLDRADAVVAHAGTGTILKALYLGKPLLVVPRLGSLGETRNDHQVGTAHHFAGQGLLQVAEDPAEFARRLDGLTTFVPPRRVSGDASEELIGALRSFVNQV
jgi:UDP-N-acetylglucosamine transferase subunit ALG13